MRSYLKIIVLLLFSIFITLFISPIIASIIPIHLYRIMSRVVLIVTFILFFYYKDRLGFQNIKELGFEFGKRWWLLLTVGFGLGIISLGIISATMLHTSVRFVIPDVLSINWLRYLTGYILIGFAVAFIEESFFREFIFQSLLKDTRLIISLLITNIFYSIVHFLKPQTYHNIEVLNLFSSIHAIGYFFAPVFKEFPNIWPSIFGLFLVGITLSMAYKRVRQLSLPIGIHAGWVVGIKSLSLGTDVTSSGSLWLEGDVVSHPISWVVLFIFILILGWRKPHAKKLAKEM